MVLSELRPRLSNRRSSRPIGLSSTITNRLFTSSPGTKRSVVSPDPQDGDPSASSTPFCTLYRSPHTANMWGGMVLWWALTDTPTPWESQIRSGLLPITMDGGGGGGRSPSRSSPQTCVSSRSDPSQVQKRSKVVNKGSLVCTWSGCSRLTRTAWLDLPGKKRDLPAAMAQPVLAPRKPGHDGNVANHGRVIFCLMIY